MAGFLLIGLALLVVELRDILIKDAGDGDVTPEPPEAMPDHFA